MSILWKLNRRNDDAKITFLSSLRNPLQRYTSWGEAFSLFIVTVQMRIELADKEFIFRLRSHH